MSGSMSRKAVLGQLKRMLAVFRCSEQAATRLASMAATLFISPVYLIPSSVLTSLYLG